MKIGLCTTDLPRAGVSDLFAGIAAKGFECVQLSFDTVAEARFQADNQIEIPDSVAPDALKLISSAAARHGLEITAVNGTFNMAHPDPAVRREGLRRFEGFARAVKALNCPMISLCSGTRSEESLWTAHEGNHTAEAWRDMADSMKAVSVIAEELRLTLAIETEASNIIDTPERAARIMRETGSQRLKMIMDCANLFHAGEAKRENARAVIGHAFDVFGADVVLAHGKDIAESGGISFCAAGEGIVDFPYFIERLKGVNYGGVMMLHGIYTPEKMAPCRRFVQALL